MGSELCTTSPYTELQFDQKNMIYKSNSYEIHVQKPNHSYSYNKLTGMAQIYSTGPIRTLIYKGEIRNFQFHRYGQLFQDQKLFYEGQFKNGLFEGWGITENYTGQFRQGHYDGYGIFQAFQNKDKQIVTFYYEGYFSQGKFSGEGIEIKNARLPIKLIEDAHKNQGMREKIELSIQHGNSICNKYQAKQIYIGQFAYGYRNGVGRLFKDNKEFNGTFLGGKTVVHGTTVDLQQEKQRRRKQKLNKSCMKC